MKIVKTIIFILIMLMCSAGAEEVEVEVYRNVVPGVPVAPGKRIGGLWERTHPKCNHDMSAIDRMKDEALRSASNYRTIAKWSWVLAGVLVLVWYFTKTAEFGGAAIISAVFSFISTLMASLVSVTYLIWIAVGVIAAVALGIYLRKKSFFEWLKEKKNVREIED